MAKMRCSIFMLQYHYQSLFFYDPFYLLTFSCVVVVKGRTHLLNPAVEKCKLF